MMVSEINWHPETGRYKRSQLLYHPKHGRAFAYEHELEHIITDRYSIHYPDKVGWYKKTYYYSDLVEFAFWLSFLTPEGNP